jgi:hypothetical protein
MASDNSAVSAALQKIINDPTLLHRIEIAKTAAERRQILAAAGVNKESNPAGVVAAVMQILATHGKPGSKAAPHVFGNDDFLRAARGGGQNTERVVEWVAALAILAVA